MDMGILVNSNKHLGSLVGLTQSAAAKKHNVCLFLMDEGTRLLEDSSVTALAEMENVKMSFCDHSAQELGVDTKGLSETIICSSQYNNAEMNHNSDKVIVL